MAIPQQYQKDFSYLVEQSNKGALNSDNAIYKSLQETAKILPEVQRALNTLRVNYV